MHSPKLRRLAIALLLVALAPTPADAGRRRPPAIKIIQPPNGAEVTFMPQRLELDLNANGDMQTLEVLLNGQDVTGSFELEPPSAGRVAAVAEFVWNGGHTGWYVLQCRV